MRPILTPDQRIQAITLYQTGASLAAVAAQFGCSVHVIHHALKAAGISRRNPWNAVPNKPAPELLRQLYLDERKSSTEIGVMYETSFAVVCRWLKEYDIPRRSASEAKKLDMERWSYDDRLRITEASRAMFTGRPRSHKNLVNRAIGVQRSPAISKFEHMLLDALALHGITPVPQLAVDKYNIDLALPDRMLAIEVHGGNWHNTSAKKIRIDTAKAKILRQHGWTIFVVKTRRQQWVDLAVTRIMEWIMANPLLQQGELDLES
jgi:very-short-patch-repair endonuclease